MCGNHACLLYTSVSHNGLLPHEVGYLCFVLVLLLCLVFVDGDFFDFIVTVIGFGNSRSNGYLFSHWTLLSGSFSISPLRFRLNCVDQCCGWCISSGVQVSSVFWVEFGLSFILIQADWVCVLPVYLCKILSRLFENKRNGMS